MFLQVNPTETHEIRRQAMDDKYIYLPYHDNCPAPFAPLGSPAPLLYLRMYIYT
jgi:hypothetical protein